MRVAWLAAALLLAAPIQAQPIQCPAGPVPPVQLPRVKAALAANQEVTVVAIGSSSTQGWHASDIAHSYPAVLQSRLGAALPQAHVAILNRGVGGQDVTEMLTRLERDVIDVRPTLVIWQVGANGAMRRMPVDTFRRLLTTGVQRLLQAGVDIVLMDNQRAPAILASPVAQEYDRATTGVANATGVELFDRGALMDRWRSSGHPFELFMSEDGVHHNDLGYRCVAEALAQAILDGLATSPSRTAAVSAQ